MSDDTKKGWGGSRVNSGRKKKAVVASSAPARIQDMRMCLRISPGSSAGGFFAPRVSQQPQVVSNPVPSTVPVDRSSTVAQLNKDLAALALDHPLDASERIFDKSLGDEDGEGDDSENAKLAQKETEEAEPKSLSENHQWLKTTLAQIVKDTNGWLKMPRCYKDEQFWGARTHSSVNVVQVLFSTVGYNENPIARRVSTLTGPDYFLLTNRYLCPLRHGNDKGCGKSYQGSDPWIIRQLPEFVQRAFPACLSARSALDTSEMDVMKATFAGHFGADPFSKMVCELKVLHHDRLNTMYYCAALHFGLRGPQQVPQFSKFDDSLGYAGYAPSRQYFKSIGADSLQTVDHQSCLPGGEPINVAMYSIVNLDEEVRAYAFTLTQSFPPLREVYERMQLELQRHGHHPTQLLYTDNPRAERKFHESVNASLCENPSNIPIDYFSLQAGIDAACNEILVALESLGPGKLLILSLSVKFTAEALHIIQLCSSKKAYIFRIRFLVSSSVLYLKIHSFVIWVGQIKSQAQVPPCLLSLLTKKRVVKIGNQIRQSMRSISAAWSMPSLACIDSSSIIDLSHIAKVKGVVSDTTSLLPTLVGTVLKNSIPDFQYLSTHDWSGEVKEDDIKKLAQEVDCVAQIYQKLTKIDSVRLPLQQSQICAGQLVTLVIGKEALAEGELVAHNGSWPSPSDGLRMKISEASTVIKLTKLLLPGHIIARHSQTLQWLMEHGGHAVVQIRTLRTRSLTPPHPSNHDPSLGVPAPVNLPSELSQHHPSRLSLLSRHTVEPDPVAYSREDEPDTGPDKQELDSDSLNNDDLAD
ncbi:hypothetical protein DFH08DRAFT_817938 [Mycena albidolilacea]|uniref:Uncharacterized protein n=1 Tax=Mycena albidolilacea TaxID=1033008 RepID=A0AAD6ZI52_9AGAR|nr:hypothetical protein DFH08DRAFT_817938 [Mycena albidolilacea]